MTRDLIIEHLTKVNYIHSTCKIAGCLSDDLFQHIWVKILEMKSDKLISIHQKGYLQFYIYRMIVNEARNPKNKFLKQMHQSNIILPFAIEWDRIGEDDNCKASITRKAFVDEGNDYDHSIDLLNEQVNTELDKMYFYDRELFKLYVKHGSLRKVEAVTGIKYGAIFQTITKVKKQINESINCRG